MGDKQTKYGIVISYIFVILNTFMGIIFTPFLVRSLGQNQYGLYEIIGSLSSNLSILNLGLGSSIVKFVSNYRFENNKEKEAEVIGLVLKIFLFISIFLISIGIVIFILFDNIYASSLSSDEIIQGKRMFLIALFNLLIVIPGGTFANVITAYEKYVVSRGLEIIKLIVRVFILVPILLSEGNATAILIIDTLLNAGIVIINFLLMKNWLHVKIIMRTTDKKLLKELLTFSVYVFFFIIIAEIKWQTDQVIIGIRLSAQSVAIYAIGTKISAIFNKFGTIISNIFLPKAVKLVGRNATLEDFCDFMVQIGRVLNIVLFYIYIAFVGMGITFIKLWMGEGYKDAYLSAVFIMTASILPLIQDSGLAILRALNKQKVISIIWLLISVANIILTWIVVPKWGINGAAFMTLCTSILGNIFTYNMYLHNKIHINMFKFFKNTFKGMIKVCGISILFFIVVYYFDLLHINWISFLIIGSLYTVIYVISIFIFYFDKEVKQKIFFKICRRCQYIK